jgi:hypothetical protein
VEVELKRMKTKCLSLIVLGGFLVVTAGISRGQSLAEIARQERAKQASQPKAVKVYTNDSIPRSTGMQETAPTSPQAVSTEASPKTPETSAAQPESATTPASGKAAEPEKQAEDKIKTKEYWQGKFSTAKADLDRADEELRLNQDELNLNQMNQARELDPNKKAVLDQEVTAKQAEVASKQEAYDKAKRAMDEVKKEFDESGAPSDWLPADEKQ